MEDLYLWNAFELFSVLIGDEVQSGPGQCLPVLRDTFCEARSLYPEWPERRYMSIDREERKRRIEIIFGDVPLAVEPALNDVPPDIYQRLVRALAAGYPPLIRGRSDVDLLLVKVPWNLPPEHLLPLVGDYLRILRAQRPVASPIKTGGPAGLIARRQRELALLGQYRLYRANRFDLERTKLAAHLDIRSSGKSFRAARRFVESLFPRRWDMLNGTLGLYRRGLRSGQ
jgi:hypothetical protein